MNVVEEIRERGRSRPVFQAYDELPGILPGSGGVGTLLDHPADGCNQRSRALLEGTGNEVRLKTYHPSETGRLGLLSVGGAEGIHEHRIDVSESPIDLTTALPELGATLLQLVLPSLWYSS